MGTYTERIRDKGIAIGERNILVKLSEKGFSVSKIAEMTDKSEEEVEALMKVEPYLDPDREVIAWKNEIWWRMREETKRLEGIIEYLDERQIVQNCQKNGMSREKLKEIIIDAWKLSDEDAENILQERWK